MSYPKFLIASSDVDELVTLAQTGAAIQYPGDKIPLEQGSFYIKGTDFHISIESIKSISEDTYLELRPLMLQVETPQAEAAIAQRVLLINANEECESQGISTWNVEICRQAYGFRTLKVKARSEQQALNEALAIAGDFEFSTKDAQYEAISVARSNSE